MAARWKLTVRQGSRVTVERFGTLHEALLELEGRMDELERSGTVRETARVFHREIEPVAQVAARVEIAGPQRMLPRVRGGIDLRGDGSPEVWTGRVNKRVVARERDEDAVTALRRGLDAAGSG